MRFCITSVYGERESEPYMSCIDFPVNYIIENYTGKNTLAGAFGGVDLHEHKRWINCGQPFGIRLSAYTNSLMFINDIERRFGMVLTTPKENDNGGTYLLVHEQWTMHPLLLHTFLLMARIGDKSKYKSGAGWSHVTKWARSRRYDTDGSFLLYNKGNAYRALRRLLSKRVRRKLDMRKIPPEVMEGYDYSQNHSYSGFKTFVNRIMEDEDPHFTHATMRQALEVCGYVKTT